MKHCKSCRHCATDTHALMMGVYIKKCRLGGHSILHPFFSGFKCNKYRKARTNRLAKMDGGNEDG